MAGRRVWISMDSRRILRRHILSSGAITLILSILMGCSWSPTAVRGGLCFSCLSSLSLGYGQFHRHTAQGIPDTGFHRQRHTFCVEHLNSIDENIKFTTEPETEGKLPFLD